MNLKNRIEDIIKDYSNIVGISMLNCIDFKRINDSNKDTEIYLPFEEKINKLLDMFGSNVENYNILNDCISTYGEFLVSKFFMKSGVNVKHIKETNSAKQPDLILKKYNCEYFAEVKTFNFCGGNNYYKKLLDDGLNSQIYLEEQKNEGAKVAQSEQVIQPLKGNKSNEEYDCFSLSMCIERHIEKYWNNYKSGQYSNNKTFSINVFIPMVYTTYGYGDLKNKLLPIYDYGNNFCSGEFWQMTYGKIDERIYIPCEYEGTTNFDRPLQRNGIFTDEQPNNSLGLMIFYVPLNGDIEIGFLQNHKKDEKVLEFIENINVPFNNIENIYRFKLIK